MYYLGASWLNDNLNLSLRLVDGELILFRSMKFHRLSWICLILSYYARSVDVFIFKTLEADNARQESNVT